MIDERPARPKSGSILGWLSLVVGIIAPIPLIRAVLYVLDRPQGTSMFLVDFVPVILIVGSAVLSALLSGIGLALGLAQCATRRTTAGFCGIILSGAMSLLLAAGFCYVFFMSI